MSAPDALAQFSALKARLTEEIRVEAVLAAEGH